LYTNRGIFPSRISSDTQYYHVFDSYAVNIILINTINFWSDNNYYNFFYFTRYYNKLHKSCVKFHYNLSSVEKIYNIEQGL